MTRKHSHPPPYRGWRSTKLHLSLITMGVLVAAFASVIVIDRANASAAFGQFVMGLLGAAGIYSAASSAEKFRAPPYVEPPEPPIPGGQ